MSCSRPIPLEDELAVGVLGRFVRLNGMSSLAWGIKSIRSSLVEANIPTLWSIAKVCGMNVPEFTAKHSLLPVLYPMSRHAESGREPGSSRGLANSYGLVVSATGLRWCPECARDDRRERGFAHWRRPHHIIGLDWCVVHQLPLICAPEESAVSSPDHSATEGLAIMSPDQVGQELGHPGLMRLQAVLVSWLQRPQPLHLRAWGEVISQRCRDLDIRMGEVGKRLVASDLILESFPLSWLRRHMPEVATKQARSFVRKVDGACIDRHVAYPTLACAAILAVLFESVEDALAALDAANLRVTAEPRLHGDVDHALDAFLAGANLDEACKRFAANVADVEARLRSSYLESRRL